MDNIDKVIRKLRKIERRKGFCLTFKSVVINLYSSNHTIKQIQDITLVLFNKWYERKQITRVIRGYTHQSTKHIN